MRKEWYMVVLAMLLYLPAAYAMQDMVIISWGDQHVVYGPGTDAALDSPEGIAAMMARLKGRGFTGIAWRADFLDHKPGVIQVHTDNIMPASALLGWASEQIAERFEVLTVARQAAEAAGLEFWVWVPTVYSDGAPTDFPGMTFPFTSVHTFVADNPDVLTVDRQGNPQYGVREYAYANARADKVEEIKWFATRWGIKNILACMRSEASQYMAPPDKADKYGFSPIIAQEMLNRYGVNIMTSSEFDIYNPAFSPTSTNVQKWHDLRGEYLTQFYRDLRQSLDTVDSAIKVGVMIPGGDYIGPILGNWRVDWRKWMSESLVDLFILPQTLAATEDWDSPTKGYLTDQLNGAGVFPINTFRTYADSVGRQDVVLLSTGRDQNHQVTPPTGSSGWRSWLNEDSFALGWYQRWRQWKKDLIDFGHIKFMNQSFDEFPLNSKGRSGGWGEYRYVPESRKCEGLWWWLGDGSDHSSGTAQDLVRHGASGAAIKLTRTEPPILPFSGRHLSIINGTQTLWSVDQVISNGTSTFSFWLYRNTTDSALSVYLSRSGGSSDIGLSFANGVAVRYFRDGGWVSGGQAWAMNTWQKITVIIDHNTKKYSAYSGDNAQYVICRNVPYTNVENYFDWVTFTPSGVTGSYCYLDDVSWNWTPDLYYTAKPKNVFLKETFEKHTSGATVNGALPDVGPQWVVSATPSSYFIENDLSFADGWKCLAVPISNGSVVSTSAAAPLMLQSGHKVTLDLDVFIETGKTVSFGLSKAGTSQNAVWLSTDAAGAVSCLSGAAMVSTGVSMTPELWYHLQMALDCSALTYTVVIQEIGSLPKQVGTYSLGSNVSVGSEVQMKIASSGTKQYVYYDNIEIHYGLPQECGDEYHPYPEGDFSQDCSVNQSDLEIFAQNWLMVDAAGDMNNDHRVDMEDFLALAEVWLTCTMGCI